MVWDCRVQLSRLSGIADICDRFRTEEVGEQRHLLAGIALQPQERTGAGRAQRAAGDHSAGYRAAHAGGGLRAASHGGLHLRHPHRCRELLLLGGKDRPDGGRGEGAGVPVLSRRPSTTGSRCSWAFPPMPLRRIRPGTRSSSPASLRKALLASHGAGLVLFTSYSLLREVYAAAQPELARAGIRLMKQGDDDRARLLDSFRAERSSVLFATDSFWEGVDAPGETLQVVILCRLPFRVPSEPILQARMAAIEERGGNPFGELSLPGCRGAHAAGIRQADAPPRRHRGGAHPGSADRHEAVRIGVPGEPARARMRSIAPAAEVLTAP